MMMTFLGIALALVFCVLLFAGAVCWLADQEEKMKDEEDYPQERPLLKVTVVKDDDNKEND